MSSLFGLGNSDKDAIESAIDNLDTIKVYAFFLSKTHHWSTPYRCLEKSTFPSRDNTIVPPSRPETTP